MVKNLLDNAGDTGSIPGSGRSPVGGNSSPLQYSFLRNLMDKGAWQARVHGVSESDTAEQADDNNENIGDFSQSSVSQQQNWVSFKLSSVQFSHIRLFATPWIAACQASLSITNSQSLFKLMFIESVMPSNHLILSSPSPPAFSLSQHQDIFQ